MSSTHASELVTSVLGGLKAQMTDFVFQNWFARADFSFVDEKTVKMRVGSKFARDWVCDNYLGQLKNEFYKKTGCETEIVVVCETPATKTGTDSTGVLLSHPQKTTPKKEATFVATNNLGLGLNPVYGFSHFIVGAENRFAHAGAQAVCEAPGKNYNPFFVYGSVGLGKTHLAHAIGLSILEKNPNKNVVCVTGETFTNEVIHAIRFDKTTELRKKYRFADVLIIDDIGFIAGKEKTMEEFFHTFNALFDSRKQIILTSDKPPRELEGFDERLKSRFAWGLSADIGKPSFETRCAILMHKASQKGVTLSDEITFEIAKQVSTNVRDLEGALCRILAFSKLNSFSLSLDLAKTVLSEFLGKTVLTVESIQNSVANNFGVEIRDLLSARRLKKLAHARQVAMYLVKKHLPLSYPEIGQKFSRDHATVMHAVGKIEKLVEQNTTLKLQIENLEKNWNF